MKVNDLSEFQAIFKEIKEAKKYEINVGVPKDVGVYKDKKGNETSILEVGERHEFGLGVPRRSFLRMPMILKQQTINKHIKHSWKQIVEGKSSAIKQLNVLGTVGQNISKDAFKTGGYGKWQKLSDATVAKRRKKSNKILMDTGALVGSVTYWVAKA